MVPDQPQLERQARLSGEAQGRGVAGVGNRTDDVGFDRAFQAQGCAAAAAHLVDAPTEDRAVGSRKVDVFEDALVVCVPLRACG